MPRCAGVGLRRTSRSATKRATALGGAVRKRRAAPTTRRGLERDWLAVSEELSAFPELAAEALARAALPARVSATDVLRASLSPIGFPRQADTMARFGQPPSRLRN